MLFADDSALVAHDVESMQLLVDRFLFAADQFSLKTISRRLSAYSNQ